MSDSDLVVIGRERSPEQQAAIERPTFVVAGTGGSKLKLKDGRIIGPFGGELLRMAKINNPGAVVVSEEKPKTFLGKSVLEQQADARQDEHQQEVDVATMFGR